MPHPGTSILAASGMLAASFISTLGGISGPGGRAVRNGDLARRHVDGATRQFVEVLEDGKLALTRGPFRVVSEDEDGIESERWGTFNSVWRLQPDGGWKVVFDAGSPASERPADDVRALLDAEDDCSPD